jgi:hypothetical protein
MSSPSYTPGLQKTKMNRSSHLKKGDGARVFFCGEGDESGSAASKHSGGEEAEAVSLPNDAGAGSRRAWRRREK